MPDRPDSRYRYQNLLILFGDVVVFILALWLSLAFRYGGRPSAELFETHLWPFTLVFIVWIIVFYIADLYGRQTVVFRKKFMGALFRTQLANSGIAVLIFYFIPTFGLTPKTILFINLLVTLVLISLWRSYISARIFQSDRERTLVIGTGKQVSELKTAINEHPQFGMEVVNLDEELGADSKQIRQYVEEHEVSVVIVNLADGEVDSIASDLYKLLFAGASGPAQKVRYMDLVSVYEEVFGREPLSLLHDKWFLQYITGQEKPIYNFLKRVLDLIISLPLAVFTTILFYPFVILAMKLEDGGPLYREHKRVGKDGQMVMVRKFRSMTTDDPDAPPASSQDRITKVGRVLRKTRLDEIPQFWSVVVGNMSLIGPRSEFPHIVEDYKREIPYYDVRHMVAPGITGWAQINYHVPAYDAKTNAEKLAYDLYYVKNRSFILDLKIALRTVRTLLLGVGS